MVGVVSMISRPDTGELLEKEKQTAPSLLERRSTDYFGAE